MPDRLRAITNYLVGGALVLLCIYMLYVGRLKKVYTDWNLNPRHGAAGEETAAALWPSIEVVQKDHPVLWEIAPYFPPYGWLDREAWFTWPFLQWNWRFLAWFVLFGSSARRCFSGYELMKLVEQLDHEDRLEALRRERGHVTASGPSLIEIRNQIQVRAAETGKWWGLNGAIVGGTIALILGTMILKWLGVIH
jgi:hypothetical protein